MNDTLTHVPSAFTGMSELWYTAWALQGITRTLDIESGNPVDTDYERDRLCGLTTAAHLLSSRLLEFADPFNDEMRPEHEAALARVAKDTGRTTAEVAARLLRTALEADIAQRDAEQAADRARMVADRLKASAAIPG